MAREIEEIERAGTDQIHKNRGSKQPIQTRTLLHVYHLNHNIKHLIFIQEGLEQGAQQSRF